MFRAYKSDGRAVLVEADGTDVPPEKMFDDATNTTMTLAPRLFARPSTESLEIRVDGDVVNTVGATRHATLYRFKMSGNDGRQTRWDRLDGRFWRDVSTDTLAVDQSLNVVWTRWILAHLPGR